MRHRKTFSWLAFEFRVLKNLLIPAFTKCGQHIKPLTNLKMITANKLTWIALLVITGSAIICYGCNPTMIPLKSKYNDTLVVFTSTKPVDSIWSNLAGIFNANGLPVQNIDKKKGIILTKKIPINWVYTYEDKDGQLVQDRAWIVLKRVFNKNKEWKATDIYGKWNIQVSETGNGNTTIKVDPFVMCTYFPNAFTSAEIQGQSTGKLEALIEQLAKNN